MPLKIFQSYLTRLSTGIYDKNQAKQKALSYRFYTIGLFQKNEVGLFLRGSSLLFFILLVEAI